MSAAVRNPTMAEFLELAAARKAACEAYFDCENEETAEVARKAGQALADLRPTDPAVLAAWLRQLIDDDAFAEQDVPGLAHVVDQLKAMATQQAGPLSSTF